MFKGIAALFTSGLIFNPMVLLGIFLALFCMIKMSAEQMKDLFSDYHLYALAALISVVYTFIFKKVYKDDGIQLDYAVMLLAAAAGVVRFVLACGLTISFVILLFSF